MPSRKRVLAFVAALGVGILGVQVIASAQQDVPDYVPPCVVADEACQEQRLAALEAYVQELRAVVAPGSTGTPTATAEPTQTPEPTLEPTVEPTVDPTVDPTVEPTETVTETPSPTPTPTEPPPPAPSTALIGMSAPDNLWSQRLAEVQAGGGIIQARRLFVSDLNYSGKVNIARTEIEAGRYPVISVKVPSWATAAAGGYDAQLTSLRNALDALLGQVAIVVHHEPNGDGTPANYAAMQAHVLPLLGAPDNVDAGVITNGWWHSQFQQGLTDAEIAQWVPQSVLDVAEFYGTDTYDGGNYPTPNQDTAASKLAELSAWATRNGVTRLGIGEFNGYTAQTITDACNALRADSRYQWANFFNSNAGGKGVPLEPDSFRMSAFQDCLALPA